MTIRWLRAAGKFIFQGLVFTGLSHGFTMDRSILLDLGMLYEDAIDREWAALCAQEQLRP